MKFCQNLKELRQEAGLTQKSLAEKCKLSAQCISSLEQGTRNPTGTTLQVLAEFFNVSVDELIGSEGFTPEERSAGLSSTRKENITPEEEQLLEAFRKIGQRHGEETQRALIEVAKSMI